MPAIDTRRGKKAPPRKPFILTRPTPDQADRTASPGRQRHRARRVEQVVRREQRRELRRRTGLGTPDQRDRNRPAAQQKLDAETVARVVRQARMDVLAKQGRGSGTRALKRLLTAGVDVQAPPTRTVSRAEAEKLRRQGKKVATGGVPAGATVGVNLAGQGGFRAMQATAQGIAKDPKTSVPKTLTGFRDMVLGFPGEVTQTAVETYQGTKHGDPLRGVRHQAQGGVSDLARRYGGINRPGGVEKMADRISKEGAAPELVDFLGAGIPAAKVLDTGLGAAARAGRLGEAAKTVTTAARPGMRISGGEAIPQARSRGFVGSVAQTRRDTAARRALAREVAKADRQAARGAAETGERKGHVHAVVREAHEQADVVPTRRTVIPGRRVVAHGRYGKLARAGRKTYANRAARSRAAQRAEQTLEINKGVYRNVASLSRAERRGLKTAIQTGARTPKAARAAIERRLHIIRTAREQGRDIETEVDEVPLLERLHAEADRVFTPRLAKIADEEVRRGARVASEDPGLGRTATERTKAAESRRYAPQARVLAVERRGIPITEALKTATAAERRAERRAGTAERAVGRAKETAARSEGAAGSEAKRVIGQIDKQIARAETVAAKHEAAAARHTAAGRTEQAEAATTRAANARARAAQLERNKAAVQPGYRRSVQQARGEVSERTKRAEELRGKHAAARQTRKLIKRQKRKGRTHIWEESAKAHQKRVRRARRQADRIEVDQQGLASAYNLHDPQTGARLTNVDVGGMDAKTIGRDAQGNRILGEPGKFNVRADIELDGKKIGSLSRIYDRETGALVKTRTSIDEAHQRKGIGSRLARAEEDALAKAGVGKVQVVPGTEAGRRLTAGLGGFKEIGEGRLQKALKAATAGGFTEPGYFPSRRRTQVRYSPRALGGSRAVSPDRRYGGELFEAGRETHDPIVYGQAIAQNIKRKHNWSLVADTIRDHAFGWGKGLSYKDAVDALGTRGIDPDSVRIIDMNALDDAAKGAAEEGGSVVSAADDLHDALTKSVHDKKSADRLIPAKHKVLILPKTIADEILADTKPSSGALRGWEIFKGKSSRILLGTSPAWLQFQVASNALMSGIGGVGPVSMAKAMKWWNGLSDEEKAAVEPYIGTGAFSGDAHSPMIGAASNSDLVNAYRSFKALPFWHAPRKALRGGSISTHGNPLDVLFRFDHAQNNFFRRAVLYNRVHRDAYRRMGKEVGTAQALQQRLMRIFQLPPEKQLDAIINDREAIEAHAKAVNDFLGDFSSYTTKERNVFQRSVMFGGFLRFSLRLLFKTMPLEHPLTTAVMARLGQLQSEEVRKLLGGDALPWQLGKYYWNDDGTLKSVNVGRLNPFLNQFTNFRGPQDLLGVLPPAAQAALNQAYTATGFTGKPFKVRGESGTDAWKGHTDRQIEDRFRIFVEQALGKTVAPYREWSKAAAYGRPQGDDSSLLFGFRPTVSKDVDTQLGIERKVAQNRRERGGVFGQVTDATLLPFKPQPDTTVEGAALRKAYDEKDTIDKQIEDFPRAKRGGEFYYSKEYQALLDKQKAKAKEIDRLQARGEPAPEPARLSRRPLSERDQLRESLKKLREGDPRAELLESIRRLREGQAIKRGER